MVRKNPRYWDASSVCYNEVDYSPSTDAISNEELWTWLRSEHLPGLMPGSDADLAQAMINDGLFDRFGRPDVVLGQHVAPIPAGVFGLRAGPAFEFERSAAFAARLGGMEHEAMYLRSRSA